MESCIEHLIIAHPKCIQEKILVSGINEKIAFDITIWVFAKICSTHLAIVRGCRILLKGKIVDCQEIGVLRFRKWPGA